MSKVVDYYYSLVSPWTYLGGLRFERIAAEAGAVVKRKPINLGKVFPVSGGLPLAKRAPQRQAYRLVELARWRDHLGMALNLEPKFFPAPDGLAGRVVIAARRAGADAGRLGNAILRAVWAEERDIADPDTLRAIAAETGIDDRWCLYRSGGSILKCGRRCRGRNLGYERNIFRNRNIQILRNWNI